MSIKVNSVFVTSKKYRNNNSTHNSYISGLTSGISRIVSMMLMTLGLYACDGELPRLEVTVVQESEVSQEGVNIPPVAFEANVTATSGEMTSISLSATDANGETLIFAIIRQPVKGTLTIIDDSTGILTYTPNAGETGVDTFEFVVSDGDAASNIAMVSIDIADPVETGPVNTPPVANNLEVTGEEDNTLSGTFPVSDADGDALRIVIVNPVQNGALSVTGNSFTYVPNLNYSGPESFTYQVTDETDSSNTATISISVTEVNDVPVAVSDIIETDEDVNANMSKSYLLGNDSDMDGDSLILTGFTQPQNGMLVETSESRMTYTPNPDFNGADSFTYTVSDGRGGEVSGTVNIQVTSVDDIPDARADSLSTQQGTEVQYTVIQNDAGLGDTPLALSISQQPESGTASLSTDGTLLYTPQSGFFGTDTLVYSITDNDGDQAVATATIVVECNTADCAQTVNLSWEPSTSADVAGYTVYVGTAPGTYTESVDAGSGTSYHYSATQSGTYYFAVTAVNAEGAESSYSNEVSSSI